MNTTNLLTDAFGRIDVGVHRVVDGIEPEALAYRPDPGGNSIAWLIWHATRIQDDHMAELAGRAQLWSAAGWARRFALPLDDADTGFGHTSEQVDTLGSVPLELLLGYHDAVTELLPADLAAVTAAGLDRIVDERWDPPVSAGVRLVSIVDDAAQHVGQAAYVRGLHDRLTG